jgi:hypothetical protein
MHPDHPLANGNISESKPPTSFEEKVTYLYEHQRITDLLNEYAYRLDSFKAGSDNLEGNWQRLFTDDCEVTYPFGTYHGREGLGEWAFEAEARFQRMQVSIILQA